MNIVDQIKQYKIVPVTVFKSLDEVKPTLNALSEGGIPVSEICFRTDVAKEAIKLAIDEFPNMLIGAGTIINLEQCKYAIKLGAKFIVSPGFCDDICLYCKKKNVPYFPGVVTPTEIIHALEMGIDHVKFFPAGVFGGLKAIKALSAAFPQVKFMPTGGVDLTNLKEFLETNSIFAIGGSFITKGNVLENCIAANKIIKGE